MHLNPIAIDVLMRESLRRNQEIERRRLYAELRNPRQESPDRAGTGLLAKIANVRLFFRRKQRINQGTASAS